jgi:hypothetical protein
VTLLPAADLVWLGWRLLDQDRQLAAQGAMERRECAADSVVAALQQAISDSRRSPADPLGLQTRVGEGLGLHHLASGGRRHQRPAPALEAQRFERGDAWVQQPGVCDTVAGLGGELSGTIKDFGRRREDVADPVRGQRSGIRNRNGKRATTRIASSCSFHATSWHRASGAIVSAS